MALLLVTTLAHAGSWSAWSDALVRKAPVTGRPLLVLVGYETCDRCRALEKINIDPVFATVRLDRDLYPLVARAYIPYVRAVSGKVDLPILLVLSPQLEPVAAVSNPSDGEITSFLDNVNARWIGDRAAMVEDAGLVVRRLTLDETRGADCGDESRTPIGRLRSSPAADRGAALVAMSGTAVYDQLGGGFHHRARDEAWHVPQFEKVLDEQAIFALAALDAWKQSGDPRLERIAQETLDAIARDFFDLSTHLFANAIAAKSLVPRNGPEVLDGGTYTWLSPEISALLGSDAAAFSALFGVLPDGNVPRDLDAKGDLAGRNVLAPADDEAEVRRRLSLTEGELRQLVDRSRTKLLSVRLKRPQPAFDEKVVTSTNALAITALARGAVAFESEEYGNSASRAIRALLSRNMDANTRVVMRSRDAGIVDATLDDYARLIAALIDTYQVTFDPSLLENAVALQRKEDAVFFRDGRYDVERGVPAVMQGVAKEDPDSAVTAAARNLLLLGSMLGNDAWRSRAAAILHIDASAMPPPGVVVIAGSLHAAETQAFVEAARRRREFPFVVTSKAARQRLGALVPPVAKIEFQPQPTATICTATGCRTEATTPDELRAFPETPLEK